MPVRTLAIASFVAVALSTGGLVAVAQTTKPVDVNRDGTVSGNERRDTNRDGNVSNREKSAAREKAEAQFKAADKNNDGGLSREEARAASGYGTIEKHFDAMDTNKDGKVTLEERRAWGKANRKSSSKASTKSDKKSSEGGLQPAR
jgi:Ca2+-binding EF-hand superfamily protein